MSQYWLTDQSRGLDHSTVSIKHYNLIISKIKVYKVYFPDVSERRISLTVTLSYCDPSPTLLSCGMTAAKMTKNTTAINSYDTFID